MVYTDGLFRYIVAENGFCRVEDMGLEVTTEDSLDEALAVTGATLDELQRI